MFSFGEIDSVLTRGCVYYFALGRDESRPYESASIRFALCKNRTHNPNMSLSTRRVLYALQFNPMVVY
jgi:hypothetical protein